MHRVGRTGRAGREGHAFTLVARQELKYLRAIEALTRQTLAWAGDGPGAADSSTPDSGAAGDRLRGSRRNGRARRRADKKPAPPKREVAAAKDSGFPASHRRARPPKSSPTDGAPPAITKRAAGGHRSGEPHGPGLAGHLPAFLRRPVR